MPFESKQQLANQANAQHSTGPKTIIGKRRSALNSLRHGLTGQVVVMPTEDLAAYTAHVKSFNDEYAPQGATESHLVQFIADTAWRLNRGAALENKLLAYATREPGHSRPASLASQIKSLASISLITQRLSRQFEKTVAQLRQIQTERRAREQAELDDLIRIMESLESQGKQYTPAENGFVFSDSQIARATQLRHLQKARKSAA